jgi:hypothetical protein
VVRGLGDCWAASHLRRVASSTGHLSAAAAGGGEGGAAGIEKDEEKGHMGREWFK